jgi:hypothetical protein
MSNCIDCFNLKVKDNLITCDTISLDAIPYEDYTKKGTPAEWKVAETCPFFIDMEKQ